MANRRMGSGWGAWRAAAAVAALGACTMFAPSPTGKAVKGTYVDLERGFAFRIPPGWNPAPPGNLLRRPPYAARFEAADGTASVSAYTGAVGSSTCIDAARRVLDSASGAKIVSDEPFTIGTPSGELPAWRGTLRAEGRRGRVSLFCSGGGFVVLEALARDDSHDRRAEELDLTVQSFAYAGALTIVPIVPPPTPVPVAYLTHVIAWRGQTLGEIARWYTGDYENWRKLTELNGLTVDDAPLRIGRRVRIPRDLVTKEEPLPRPRPKRPAARPKPVAEPAAETRPIEEAPAEARPIEERPTGVRPPDPDPLPSVIGPK